MSITVAPCQEINRLRTMADLRRIFPTADAVNAENFCLFSTSGIHGSFTTIEDIELELADWTEGDDPARLTVMVVMPRCVTLYFGHIEVTNGDIGYLKGLRQSSWDVLQAIGDPR